ncbi:hypothetical protein CW357_00770 [Rummeliibacillus sp. TYF005]|uniref:hypothetical protein n=1 Tax=Rummeliibacillus sp. TYF005 TaxID=2058214 RepID=UPI000F53D2F3|nr:hypothetical protein [Rummeliibacillus sp. TYF005]RPJ97235.1 hypothetical protein CW357_00770 [Rummeliibacillus sp. TYF005]
MPNGSKDFKELVEKMTNTKLWDDKHFDVYPYEAGVGKSKKVQELLASTPYRALYVQRFVKDNAMNKTVENINKLANEENRACKFTSEESGKGSKLKDAKDSKVLCITHKMYHQICLGYHQELIEERKILIIDEHPDVFEKKTFSFADLGHAALFARIEKNEILKNIVENIIVSLEKIDNINSMMFAKLEMDYTEDEIKEYIRLIDNLKKMKSNEDRKMLEKLKCILENPSFIVDRNIETYDSDFQFSLLDCNIILDASAEIDYRYEISDIFTVHPQQKVLNYSTSLIKWFDLNTGEIDYRRDKGSIHQIIFESLETKPTEKVLFITSNAISKNLKNIINDSNQLRKFDGRSLIENYEIDYFGNLIGKNDYKDCDVAVLMKTPNYNYVDYFLIYAFYNSQGVGNIKKVELFQEESIEKMRLSLIACDYYQSMRRIARKTGMAATYFIYTKNIEAIKKVMTQLPNIQFEECKIPKIRFPKVKKETVADKLISYLEECQQNKLPKVSKKVVCENIGIDRHLLSREIKKIKTFLKEKNIKVETRYFDLS